MSRLTIAAVVAITVAMTLPGCNRGPRTGTRPNVLLISVDTLRPDHLGTYGYGQATSPAIDGLAAQGALFEHCISTAAETAPGGASILTGLYQDSHLVTHNLATLPEDVSTLAERLEGAGYRTAGFTGNFLLGPRYGFSQGLGTTEDFAGGNPLEARDHIGAERAIAWLTGTPDTSRERSRPWFLWVHFMDPHGPYSGAGPEWSESFHYDSRISGEDRPLEVSASNFGLGVLPRYQRIEGLTRPSQYIRRYDGEIRYMDDQVARLLRAVDDLGASDETLVVFTADHGESLVEHDEYFQHSWSLYDAALRVPLILRLPGAIVPGTRIGADTIETSVVDIVPTVLSLTGVEFEAGDLDGRSLAPTLLDGVLQPSRPVFAYGARKNHPFALVLGGRKLIHTPAGAPPVPNAERPANGFDTAQRYELYEIASDPGETTNLYDHAENSDLRSVLTTFEEKFLRRFWERKAALRDKR